MAMIKCPDCGKDISNVAPACIHCGRPIIVPPAVNRQTHPPREPVKKKNSISGWIGLFVLIAIGIAIYNSGDDDSGSSGSPSYRTAGMTASTDSVPNHTPAPPVLKATPAQLYAAYTRNEVAADDEFKGKTIQVTAPVKSIDKDFTDAVVLRFDTGSEFNEMGATLESSQDSMAAQLKRGQVVTLQCAKIVRIMDSPMASHCTLNP